MAPTYTPTDAYPTSTSHIQRETEELLLKHLPLPRNDDTKALYLELHKTKHMQWLVRNLAQGFPARYVSQDASQPWLMFWTLQAFSILGVALDPGNKQRAIDTILTWQHPDGGFGGGPGQAAHLLPTYAAVCALAIAGRPGERGGWDQIDRAKMSQFFISLKQPDGSFLVARHAEVDMRGIYCLLAVATLLDLMTPELVDGTAEFVRSCQTYEGGFASASQPYFGEDGALLKSPKPPLGEAHGGYTFCALASWVLLQPMSDNKLDHINETNLLRWLVQMQGVEIELGGFKGRTNKLVDGCYSWWVGGAFALLEAIHGHHSSSSHDEEKHEDGDAGWVDVDESLFNREALQEYILLAGQHPAGGLRDKPPKSADAYHTLYCLAGLSAAQHRVFPSEHKSKELKSGWKGSDNSTRKKVFTEALCWQEDEAGPVFVGGKANRVNASHPLFNLTVTHSVAIMRYFYGQES
ncbi:terpenoid cyclases/Protein prenyltransferase [Guyanagaster necrorhizus]|uniref:Protein farnesyltransferase subunit beta n=1 Tax=Guyanagaster necrorhizus TaxID=856835 RepID=A0A9P7VNC7_9AGAR|nr:terpenoid cyclases/Protein prenyltransferase [Guyanagaster necrorhizus MCA 3950]KAG7443637.1 terpenoid cyclases/Protein prenyltransferase [Guyanagaster necrorhizus MCA 3950]